jgi:predicted secreted hydrolase
VTYWEGAIKIGGTADGRLASGSGYVELTGYAETRR